jgi:putative hydrolase of the HAD superfamily
MIKAVIFDCFGVLTSVDATSPNHELFAYIGERLRPDYRIGLLSNVGSDRLDELFEAEQQALIDQAILSYQIGVSKPDAAAYEIAANKLGVLPHECIFIDDIVDFALAAEQVGMRGIQHTENASTIAKLEELLGA